MELCLLSSDESTNSPLFKRWPEREDGPMEVEGNLGQGTRESIWQALVKRAWRLINQQLRAHERCRGGHRAMMGGSG